MNNQSYQIINTSSVRHRSHLFRKRPSVATIILVLVLVSIVMGSPAKLRGNNDYDDNDTQCRKSAKAAGFPESETTSLKDLFAFNQIKTPASCKTACHMINRDIAMEFDKPEVCCCSNKRSDGGVDDNDTQCRNLARAAGFPEPEFDLLKPFFAFNQIKTQDSCKTACHMIERDIAMEFEKPEFCCCSNKKNKV